MLFINDGTIVTTNLVGNHRKTFAHMAFNKKHENVDFPDVSFLPPASEFELDVIELADLKRRAKHMAPSPDTEHRVGFNLVIFIEQGEGHHKIDFEEWQFSAGSALFVNSGQIQAFDFSADLKGKAILYTENFLDTLNESMMIPFSLSANMPYAFAPILDLTPSLKKSVIRLTEELHNETSRAAPSKSITMSLFSAMLQMLARERDNPTATFSKNTMQKFLAFQRLLETHFRTSREAVFYANKLGMNYKTLNQICHKMTDTTVKSYIGHHITLEAKRRLIIGATDIASVAFDLGFDEPTNFTKFFKRYTQMTPRQFCNKVQK